MSKRTSAMGWGRVCAVSLLMVCGVAGCGRGPTGPSQGEQSPGPTATSPPDLMNPAPTILSITPSIGSIGGGAAIAITGAGLQPGLRVAFGTTNVIGFFGLTSDRIFVTTPSHAPGTVDVVVTNVDGQQAVAIGAYTFAAPESFAVDGNWRGVSFAGEYDEPFTLTVEHGAVVSITCASSGLMPLSPPAPIVRGEFRFSARGGVEVSGRILAPNEAKGVVNVDPFGHVRRPCVDAEWHANKQ
jgi:hypothetical protein